MALNWRETLRTLSNQFEARAARTPGLHHLFVEVADRERYKMSGPSWFAPYSCDIRIVDGRPELDKWDMTASSGLPGISPGFREAKSDELFGVDDEQRIVRDGSGVARAVRVPMKLRQGYYCGRPSEESTGFKSLANVAATALAGASDLAEHAFASDLTDIFRKPYSGVRYVFGDVPQLPTAFMAQAWNAGVLQYENGVVIDVPISENNPDADYWVFLLHRLGWRHFGGSGLQAGRWAWKDNVEVALETLTSDWSHYPDNFCNRFADISKDSFYSVLGTKEVPLDVNLASVLAIQMLLADLTPSISADAKPSSQIDYSREAWQTREIPNIRPTARDESDECCTPRIGVLVATEVERQAVLKRMRPPGK